MSFKLLGKYKLLFILSEITKVRAVLEDLTFA